MTLRDEIERGPQPKKSIEGSLWDELGIETHREFAKRIALLALEEAARTCETNEILWDGIAHARAIRAFAAQLTPGQAIHGTELAERICDDGVKQGGKPAPASGSDTLAPDDKGYMTKLSGTQQEGK